jgi:hypothetical protein cdiviTM7_02679
MGAAMDNNGAAPGADTTKRTLIDKSAKTMFIAVTVASVIVGFSLVFAFRLGEQALFTMKVNAKKQETVRRLEENKKAFEELKRTVQQLQANQALNQVKAKPDDNAVRVILDALPDSYNSDALGASLQQKLLAGVSGLEVQSINVETIVEGKEGSGGSSGSSSSESANAAAINTSTAAKAMPFEVVVKGNTAAIKKMFENFNRSIRAIDITSVDLNGTETGDVSAKVSGVAYYQPGKKIELKNEKVKP